MKTTTVVAVAIATLMAAQALAQGGVTIASFNQTTIPSFGTVTVTGSGFDPANGAISLIVTPRGGIALTIPVFSATTTTLQAVVPAFVNATSGELFNAPVVADLQVVQVTRSSIATSNVLGGLTVEPPPANGNPAGMVTTAFLETMVAILGDVRAARPAQLSAAIDAVTASQADLIAAVRAAAAGRSVLVGTPEGQIAGLTPAAVQVSDRLILSLLERQAAVTPSAIRLSSRGLATEGACACAANGLDEKSARLLCEFRRNPCVALDTSREVVPAAAAGVYGFQLGFLSGWAASGLAAAGALGSSTATVFGYLSGQAIGYMTAIHAGVTPPAIASSLRDAGATLLEQIASFGVGLPTSLNTAMSLGQEMEKIVIAAKGASTTAPRAGVVLPAPGTAPSGSRPVMAYLAETAANATAHALAASDRAITVLLGAAAMPAPSAASFNGAYSGSTTLTCTFGDGSTDSMTFPVAMTVSNGAITVSSGPASGSGQVSPTGVVTSGAALASGASCRWGGRFSTTGTGAGASGFVSCRVTGVPCAGSWSVAGGR